STVWRARSHARMVAARTVVDDRRARLRQATLACCAHSVRQARIACEHGHIPLDGFVRHDATESRSRVQRSYHVRDSGSATRLRVTASLVEAILHAWWTTYSAAASPRSAANKALA